MDSKLRIIAWNANGLNNHTSELAQFLSDNHVDIALIAETHLANEHRIKIHGYKLLATNHPGGSKRGGAAILIKENLKYTELDHYKTDHIQSTIIEVKDNLGPIKIAAIYSPPRHRITCDQYTNYLKLLGHRFLVAGDFNAKNTIWGSRTTSTKGKNLYKAILKTKAKHLSTGEPTYWPTDPNKTPDLIDFCITRNINETSLQIKSKLDLSSDHSPIQIDYNTNIERIKPSNRMYNKKTDWETFREYIRYTFNTQIQLNSPESIEQTIIYINDTINKALYISTPTPDTRTHQKYTPVYIKKLIDEKKKLRKIWQTTRHPDDKTKLNKARKNLTSALIRTKNHKINNYLRSLTPNSETNYSLWKATKALIKKTPHQPPLKKTNNTWARTDAEKSTLFADHFEETFTHHSTSNNTLPANTIQTTNYIIKNITPSEIRQIMKNKLKQNKSPGYDQLTGTIIKELPGEAINLLCRLFNYILLTQHFPVLWKIAEIIAIPKPGKDLSKPTSYRPISLLPILSKIFEKLLCKRIQPLLADHHTIPDHQFGFRQKHSTIEQVHRVTQKILTDLDDKKFCVGIFLDIEKAFDKVWHAGLIHKLYHQLPQPLFNILKSYITGRYFYVKYKDSQSTLRQIKAGIPQGTVLGPLLYNVYTADIPIPRDESSMIATFADDTVILYSNTKLTTAMSKMQRIINETTRWFEKWKIKINEQKTVQVIYTTRTKYQPQTLQLNQTNIPNVNAAKYLGMYIDNKLTWKHHIEKKRDQIKNKFRQLYWLLSNNSTLSIDNKLLIYKSIIKPIWTYGIQLWGTAKRTNIEIIQRQQSKILRAIMNADWYIRNDDIHDGVGIPMIIDEIRTISRSYHNKLADHSNKDINNLPIEELTKTRRLQRKRPVDNT